MTRRAGRQTFTHAERLAEFLRVGDALLERRVLQSGFQSTASLKFEQGVGLSVESRGPDLEDYRSFWLDMRKLLANDSPANFSRAMRSAMVEFSQVARPGQFESFRRAWNQTLDTSPLELRVDGKVWRPKELIDLWVNGVLFHDDASKRRTWDQLADPSPFMVQFVIDNAVATLVQVAMHAIARIDFLQGGSGIVSIIGGRAAPDSAGDPPSADDLSDATIVA